METPKSKDLRFIFNCPDCDDREPCGYHEELAESMCEEDGERSHKGEE